MNKLEQLLYLNRILLEDMPQYKKEAIKFEENIDEQQRLFRSLINVRPPMSINDKFLKVQDEYLKNEVKNKGVVDISNIESIKDNIYLWQGDITRLSVDAIVNAANSKLLGCFIPCHGCIDNAIHSASGLMLREECFNIMESQKCDESTGDAKITKAYNLPSSYVIHTVGPIIRGELTDKDIKLLSKCYRSCLELAISKKMKSIAFCCISTGEFCFPNQEAAEIAIKTVSEIIEETKSEIGVIFNVFKDVDYTIYKNILSKGK